MKKNFQTYLYSVVGVVVLVLIVIAFNVITSAMKVRVDLTKEKAYTLSPGTRSILSKLDTPVTLRFYYSSSAELTQDTLFLKTYAQRVEDLLAEYKQAAKGKLTIINYNPKPDTDAEDSARLDGVEGQMLPTSEKFYLGISVGMLDAKEAIPFLDPRREPMMEYDISRAISRVITPDKPVIGIMSSLPVMGTPNAAMMRQMGQQAQDPWTIVDELKGDFTVKPVEMTATKIDDDIRVLVVVHPKNISDAAQYAIDQFIMRGGKLVAFLDGTSIVDKRNDSNPMMAQMPGGGSSLDKLLTAWGLHFDPTKVVADLNYKMQLRGRNGQPSEEPAFLAVTGDGINKDDIATSEVGDVWLPLCGAFTGTPVAGLKETVLLKSTKDSQLVEGIMAGMGGASLLNDFKPSGTEYALAVRLTGKFKTAFPDGKPKDPKGDDKTAEKSTDALKETKAETSVVLFGDTDFIYDQFALDKQNVMGMTMVRPLNGNLNVAQNVIEQMAGDSDLIGARSRAVQSRPLTRIHEMDAKAQEANQVKIKEFEDSRRETQEKISELQRNKDQGQQRFILSPEQQAELTKLQKKAADLNLQMRQQAKQMKREKESLENWLKWSDILVMPGLVTISGIGLAIFKKKRTSAK